MSIIQFMHLISVPFWTYLANAIPIANILDFKSRGRLGRDESAIKVVGVKLKEKG